MAIQDYLGIPVEHIGSLKHRVSYKEKKANNWKWIEEWIDYYDAGYDSNVQDEEIEKILFNYRLWNGRGVYKTQVDSPINSSLLQEEGLYFEGENIAHYDIITPIGKSLYGQQQMMSLRPIATDTSLTNVNIRKKKKLQLRQQWLEETYINPIKEQAKQEWMLENNVQDLNTIPPEQQQQAQQQIQQKASYLTPSDIDRYMAEEYKSPSETQLQKITDFVLKRDKLKYWTDENFKHLIISGKEAFDTGIRNGSAYARILNPAGLRYGGGDNAHFLEDMDWVVYEEYITLSQLFNDHGSEITPSMLKKLELAFNDHGSPIFNRGEFPEPMNTRIAQHDARTGFFDKAPNLKTKEGQEFIKTLYSKFGSHSYAQLEGIRRIKVVFKSLTKVKLVDRFDREQNKYTQFWVDDSYEKNPFKDIRVREVWIPCVYQGYKVLEGSNAFYFEKGEVPNQYKSYKNPFDVKLPIIGGEYSKLFNNTENVAPLDLAKPWQDMFNIKMASIQQREGTNIGNVFAVSMNMKPKDWTWGKYLMMIKYGKIVPLDTSNEDINGIDGQMLKSMNLSDLQNLAADLQQLDWIRNQAALSMSYNPARLGQIVPQQAVTNAKENITQSSYQTQDLFTIHNEIVERLLNRHILNERAALKDNDFVASYILDDMSRADLILDKELFDMAEIGIVVRNNSEEFKALMDIKSLGQAMIQNQMITFPEFIRMYLANNMADMLNISERAEKKMLERQQEAQQAQQEQAKMVEQMRADMQKMQMEYDAQQRQLDRLNKIDVVGIDAMKFKNQMDVDANNISDSKETEAMKLEQETIENQKDRDHEIELKKIEAQNKKEVEAIKARNKPKSI